MDKDHRLDAPDNEALRTIEQVSDHSGLTTIYPHAHTEWDGIEITSRDQREAQRAAEQVRINMTIRKWFVPVGLLVPLPFVFAVLLIAVAAQYLRIENLWIMMLPVFGTVALWLYVSYRALKAVYNIFYAHSIKATPFLIALGSLLLLSINLVHGLTQFSHSTSIIVTTAIVGGAMMLLSVILSAILLFVWTSRRLPAGVKIGIIVLLAACIGAGTFALRAL